MQDTISNRNQPVANPEQPLRKWEDVAKQIINEPDSEKLSVLVKELCEILDKAPTATGVENAPDLAARIAQY